ncbi:MAG: hypothetical protein PWQ18_675 [Clostridia bacterium]|nr:hypothetical protein [Clostridia bacterium]
MRALWSNAAAEAYRDGLTGCYNRRFLDHYLQDGVEAFRKGRGGFSLLMCDIDHFKRVNDTYGHQAGDEVLRRFGEFLRSFCRETDVVARYGGEEFAVVFPRTPRDLTLAVADRLRESWRQKGVYSTTFSGGVAELGVDAPDAAGVIAAADQALYRAKESGRNKVLLAGVEPEAPARLVAASPAALQARVLVVMGASRRVGATAFALALAAFLAGRGAVEVVDAGGGALRWLRRDRRIPCRGMPPFYATPGVTTIVDAGVDIPVEAMPFASVVFLVTDMSPGAWQLKPPLAGRTYVVGNRGASYSSLQEFASYWGLEALCVLPESHEIRKGEEKGTAPLPRSWLKSLRQAIEL